MCDFNSCYYFTWNEDHKGNLLVERLTRIHGPLLKSCLTMRDCVLLTAPHSQHDPILLSGCPTIHDPIVFLDWSILPTL